MITLWGIAVVLTVLMFAENPQGPLGWLGLLLGALAFTTPFFACFAVGWYWCRWRGVPYLVEVIVCGFAFFFASLISQMLFNLMLPPDPLNWHAAAYWGVLGLIVPAMTRLYAWAWRHLRLR